MENLVVLVISVFMIGLCFGYMLSVIFREEPKEDKEPEISIKNPYYKNDPVNICRRRNCNRPARSNDVFSDGLCNSCHDMSTGLS